MMKLPLRYSASISLLLVWSFSFAVEDAPFSALVLDNGQLRVVLDVPDLQNGRYQGVRFDPAGQIRSARYQGLEFYGPWKELLPDGTFRDGLGPSEEFSMDEPLGYEAAGIGDEFVKIAVGVLRRTDEKDYVFYKSYPVVDRGSWTNRHGALWTESEHVLVSELGWAYRYTKRVELDPHAPRMTISRRLQNTGSRTIDTDHYVHNFVVLGDRIPDQHIEMETAFSITPTHVLNETAIFDGNRIRFDAPMRSGGHWENLVLLTGDHRTLPASYNYGLWRDRLTGAQLEFRGSEPIWKFVFYGVNQSLSLEPFIRVLVEPGQSMEWSTIYTFSKSEPQISKP